MTDTTASEEAWFYTQGGQRKGPVPINELRELLAAQTIDGETPSLAQRAGRLATATRHGNRRGAQGYSAAHRRIRCEQWLVWALAFAPIAYLLVDVALLKYQNNHPLDDTFFETFLSPLGWLIPVLVNGALYLVDTKQLKCAGYSSGWMTFFALLLAPIYLFVRAQRLRRTPTYGFV